MFSISLQLFCIYMVLTIIKINHATAYQYTRAMLFERDVMYDGIAPNDEYVYIQNVTSDDNIHCCLFCEYNRPSCVGVLYNKEQMECKLLKRYLTPVDKLGNSSHEEWEYWIIMKDSDKIADCKRTTKGWDYRGKINVTKSGRSCQFWASQSPHSHGTGTNQPENYCRNPYGEPGPWCYTTDPDKRWEFCDIPMCVTPPLECLTSHDLRGLSYFGKQNVVNTGDLCQRWDSQYPHKHPNGELADQDNYCRNPDGEDAPWCYTINPNIRWSECIIPRC